MKMKFAGILFVMAGIILVVCYAAMCMAGETDRASDQYWEDFEDVDYEWKDDDDEDE